LDAIGLPEPVFWALRGIYVFFGGAALLANLYAWPLLVSFDLGLRRLTSVSLRLAITHIRWSLFTLGLTLLPLSFALVIPLIFSTLIIFSTAGLIVSWGSWRVIKQYATPEELAALDAP
jgi:uncharacterized membrane protein YesL